MNYFWKFCERWFFLWQGGGAFWNLPEKWPKIEWFTQERIGGGLLKFKNDLWLNSRKGYNQISWPAWKLCQYKGGVNKMNTLFVLDTTNFKPLNEILHNILTFIYFLAHQIGLGIIKTIQSIFPRIIFPYSIIDPLGFLVILTLFMFLVGVDVARKIVWIIVCAAWILLVIRILMILFKLG